MQRNNQLVTGSWSRCPAALKRREVVPKEGFSCYLETEDPKPSLIIELKEITKVCNKFITAEQFEHLKLPPGPWCNIQCDLWGCSRGADSGFVC